MHVGLDIDEMQYCPKYRGTIDSDTTRENPSQNPTLHRRHFPKSVPQKMIYVVVSVPLV